MKARFTFTPYNEELKENRSGRIVIDAQIDNENEEVVVCVINSRTVSIPNAKGYSINVPESGQNYYKEFVVFSSNAGCTIQAKSNKTKIFVSKKRIE